MSETAKNLSKCIAELESLRDFKHDNQYVGILITNRMLQLGLSIKTYRDILLQQSSLAGRDSFTDSVL